MSEIILALALGAAIVIGLSLAPLSVSRRTGLLLVAADRVDSAEHRLRSFASTRPDVPATGLRSEFTRGGLRSRRGRSDARHHLLDPVVVAGPWVAVAGAAVLGVRKLARLRG